jgi:hypothetical protein
MREIIAIRATRMYRKSRTFARRGILKFAISVENFYQFKSLILTDARQSKFDHEQNSNL